MELTILAARGWGIKGNEAKKELPLKSLYKSNTSPVVGDYLCTSLGK